MEFLGTKIDESWPSDIKYSIKLLSSNVSKDFFSGLKLLASIYEFNMDSPKRESAEKILQTLCKILPSFIKKGEERFDLNKTKIDDAVQKNRHPLRVIRPRDNTRKNRNLVPLKKSMQAISTDEKDEIRIISVEDQDLTEETLVNELKREGVPSCEPDVETVEISLPGDDIIEGEVIEQEMADLFDDAYDEDDEWVGADYYKNSAELKYIFDDHGNVKKDLEEGLDLLNPMEKEMRADLNISASSGYKDVYNQSPVQTPLPRASFQPETSSSLDEEIDLDVYNKVDLTPGESVIGQRCALGDGAISEMDGYVYTCKKCGAVFHLTCGKLVINLQGGRCPICDESWK